MHISDAQNVFKEVCDRILIQYEIYLIDRGMRPHGILMSEDVYEAFLEMSDVHLPGYYVVVNENGKLTFIDLMLYSIEHHKGFIEIV